MPTKVAEQWNETGYVKLQGHLTEEDQRALSAEARERRSKARATEHLDQTDVTVDRACIISSPSSAVAVRGGAAMDALMANAEFKEIVQSRAERALVPVIKGYKFYRDGDFLGIRTDLPQCDLTVTFAISDGLNVHYYPDGYKRPRSDLEALYAGGHVVPRSTHFMPLETTALNIFSGRDLPHARPLHSCPEAGIATVCYYAT